MYHTIAAALLAMFGVYCFIRMHWLLDRQKFDPDFSSFSKHLFFMHIIIFIDVTTQGAKYNITIARKNVKPWQVKM